jgi:hypothetical protein
VRARAGARRGRRALDAADHPGSSGPAAPLPGTARRAAGHRHQPARRTAEGAGGRRPRGAHRPGPPHRRVRADRAGRGAARRGGGAGPVRPRYPVPSATGRGRGHPGLLGHPRRGGDDPRRAAGGRGRVVRVPHRLRGVRAVRRGRRGGGAPGTGHRSGPAHRHRRRYLLRYRHAPRRPGRGTARRPRRRKRPGLGGNPLPAAARPGRAPPVGRTGRTPPGGRTGRAPPGGRTGRTPPGRTPCGGAGAPRRISRSTARSGTSRTRRSPEAARPSRRP